jgi:hypothetical protein
MTADGAAAVVARGSVVGTAVVVGANVVGVLVVVLLEVVAIVEVVCLREWWSCSWRCPQQRSWEVGW